MDVSCAQEQFIDAPRIENGEILKYARIRGVQKPKDEQRKRKAFMVAIYECYPGYTFQKGNSGRLYCSKRTWIGQTPTCEIDNDSKLLDYLNVVLPSIIITSLHTYLRESLLSYNKNVFLK